MNTSITDLERQLINEQLAKCLELAEKHAQLVDSFNVMNFISLLLAIALAVTYLLIIVAGGFYLFKKDNSYKPYNPQPPRNRR